MLPLLSPQSCREALHPETVDTDSDFLTILVAPGLGLLPRLLSAACWQMVRSTVSGHCRPWEDRFLLAGTEQYPYSQLVFFHATELPCCMHWNLAAQKPGPHQVQRSDKIHLSPKS